MRFDEVGNRKGTESGLGHQSNMKPLIEYSPCRKEVSIGSLPFHLKREYFLLNKNCTGSKTWATGVWRYNPNPRRSQVRDFIYLVCMMNNFGPFCNCCMHVSIPILSMLWVKIETSFYLLCRFSPLSSELMWLLP